MKYDNQIKICSTIIELHGENAACITGWKNFFAGTLNKWVSNRQEQASEMVYCFYRLGHAAKDSSAEENILTGLFFMQSFSMKYWQLF